MDPRQNAGPQTFQTPSTLRQFGSRRRRGRARLRRRLRSGLRDSGGSRRGRRLRCGSRGGVLGLRGGLSPWLALGLALGLGLGLLGGRGRRRGHGEHTGLVAGLEGQHQLDVVVGVVVAEGCPRHACLVGEAAAGAAQVDSRAEGAVVDVVGVLHLVAVTVAGDRTPRLGQELHLADGPVPHLVAVQGAVVAVLDRGEGAGAVELGPADLRSRYPVSAQLGAAEPTVVRLHPPDGGQQGPGDLAARVRPSPSPSPRGGRRAARPGVRRWCRCC